MQETGDDDSDFVPAEAFNADEWTESNCRAGKHREGTEPKETPGFLRAVETQPTMAALTGLEADFPRFSSSPGAIDAGVKVRPA